MEDILGKYVCMVRLSHGIIVIRDLEDGDEGRSIVAAAQAITTVP